MRKIVNWAALMLMSVGLGVGLNLLGFIHAYAYEPIDDLIMVVNQLHQAGDIEDVGVMANLVVNLETIGTLADQGNTETAKSLMTAFVQEVQSLSGALMTSSAANQIVTQANDIATTL